MGSIFASISEDNSARIWNTNDWASVEIGFSETTTSYPNFGIIDIDFSYDGKNLAIVTNWSYPQSRTCPDPVTGENYPCTSGSVVNIFETSHWKLVAEQVFDKYRIVGIKFSPKDPIMLYKAQDNAIHSFSLNNSKDNIIVNGYYPYYCPVEISIDGKYLVSCNNNFNFLVCCGRKRCLRTTL